MEARKRWVQLYLETKDAGLVCRRCGISRPTLRKWARRFSEAGLAGLESRSRRPLNSPRRKITAAHEAHVLGLRVHVDELAASTWKQGPASNYFVDTLSVALDLSAGVAKMRTEKGVGGKPKWGYGLYQRNFDELVRLTKRCILINARRSNPVIHYIRLVVRGEPRYRSESGVFRVGPPILPDEEPSTRRR